MVANAASLSEHQVGSASRSGRDANGRFAKGNRGGPGNPFARQVAQLRKTLLARVTSEDIAEMAEVVLNKAKAGDMAAAKLLFSYVLGKPLDGLNPDGVDHDEWQRWQEEAQRCSERQRVTTHIDIEWPLDEARIARERKIEDWNRQIEENLTTEVREIQQEGIQLAQRHVHEQLKAMEARPQPAATLPRPSDNGVIGPNDQASADGANGEGPLTNGQNGQRTVAVDTPKKPLDLSPEMRRVLNQVVFPALAKEINGAAAKDASLPIT